LSAQRNPEERRQRIIRAAHELIPAVGVQGLTHRLIADRAQVPLGSTTYYFATLADLVDAALGTATNGTAECLRDWGERLQASTDVPATLAALVSEWVQDRDQLATWNELYAAAWHRPELRPLARIWSDGLADLLTAHAADRQAARNAAAFVDGAVMHALIRDEPVDPIPFARVLAALLEHRSG
jgi:TetR/AcrR family transcriptional regulator, regulator of biofilm formation and stress response